jgi:hypothetical protein
MNILNIRKPLVAILACSAVLASLGAIAAAPAPTPHAFTATYEVQRGGSSIGESTLTLRRDGNGQWIYSSKMRGTSGLAALLGASVEETSRFRWHDARPETVSYDYAMDAAVKHKSRHVAVDWTAGTVAVDDGKKGKSGFATQPGMVERHLVPLALGWALAADPRQVTLPVAVRDRVEQQHYAVVGKESVTVPAGTFQAVRVNRTDDDKGFSAWYVPGKYAMPVKLAQSDGGDITLLLKTYSQK